MKKEQIYIWNKWQLIGDGNKLLITSSPQTSAKIQLLKINPVALSRLLSSPFLFHQQVKPPLSECFFSSFFFSTSLIFLCARSGFIFLKGGFNSLTVWGKRWRPLKLWLLQTFSMDRTSSGMLYAFVLPCFFYESRNVAKTFMARNVLFSLFWWKKNGPTRSNLLLCDYFLISLKKLNSYLIQSKNRKEQKATCLSAFWRRVCLFQRSGWCCSNVIRKGELWHKSGLYAWLDLLIEALSPKVHFTMWDCLFSNNQPQR